MADEPIPSPVAGTHWKSAVEAQRAAQLALCEKVDPKRPWVILSLPTTGTMCSCMIGAVQMCTVKPEHIRPKLDIISLGFSAVTGNFNQLWCKALNQRRRKPVKYYVMAHEDINPQAAWLDILTDEMEATGADVMSVVTPLKNEKGLASNGLFRSGGNTFQDFQMGVHRFSMKEIIEELPPTFSVKELHEKFPSGEFKGTSIANGMAINNSLWICRFDESWVQDVCFTMDDWIYKLPNEGETQWVDERGITHGWSYHMGNQSDDWKFGRFCHERGLKVYVTRKVQMGHIGRWEFKNDDVWGLETEEAVR